MDTEHVLVKDDDISGGSFSVFLSQEPRETRGTLKEKKNSRDGTEGHTTWRRHQEAKNRANKTTSLSSSGQTAGSQTGTEDRN